HNAYFARTNRHMVETASLNASRIRGYEDEHGLRTVERFMDAVLSIQEHVDPHAHLARQAPRDAPQVPPQRLKRTTEFDDMFSLTPDDTTPTSLAIAGNPQDAPPASSVSPVKRHFPAEPQKDLVGFIMEHSRYLEPWQRDVIGIIREEMLYFVPQ